MSETHVVLVAVAHTIDLDRIAYSIREDEGKGWDGPSVKAWGLLQKRIHELEQSTSWLDLYDHLTRSVIDPRGLKIVGVDEVSISHAPMYLRAAELDSVIRGEERIEAKVILARRS